MRSLLVFLPAAAMTLMLSTPFAVQNALAKPIPIPSLPRAFGGFANVAARTDRSSTPNHLASHTTAVSAKPPKAPSRITAGHTERKAARSVSRVSREPSASAHGSSNASSGKLARLRRYHRQALQHAANYRTLVKFFCDLNLSFSHRQPGFERYICIRVRSRIPTSGVNRALWIPHELCGLHFCSSRAWRWQRRRKPGSHQQPRDLAREHHQRQQGHPHGHLQPCCLIAYCRSDLGSQ